MSYNRLPSLRSFETPCSIIPFFVNVFHCLSHIPLLRYHSHKPEGIKITFSMFETENIYLQSSSCILFKNIPLHIKFSHF